MAGHSKWANIKHRKAAQDQGFLSAPRLRPDVQEENSRRKAKAHGRLESQARTNTAYLGGRSLARQHCPVEIRR